MLRTRIIPLNDSEYGDKISMCLKIICFGIFLTKFSVCVLAKIKYVAVFFMKLQHIKIYIQDLSSFSNTLYLPIF